MDYGTVGTTAGDECGLTAMDNQRDIPLLHRKRHVTVVHVAASWHSLSAGALSSPSICS